MARDARSSVPLSIVVVAYNIERELPRTLRSLAVGYQRNVDAGDYEVIVVDNGSRVPIDASVFAGLEGQFRLLRIDDAPPSPAHAVNRGIAEARGEMISVMLDGARLVTPRFVHFTLVGSRAHPNSAVATLGWYLGYDHQRHALLAGWTKDDEDQLLESIDWPNDGYRLFEIATMDESSTCGWFQRIFESNGFALPRSAWKKLGGFDESFDAPGGGIVNHDTLRRAAELDDLGWVILIGEATFHQLHGGIATNVSPTQIEESIAGWKAQYEALRGQSVEPPVLADRVLLGTLPDAVRPQFAHALNAILHVEKFTDATPRPAVPLPDPAKEPDPVAAAWMTAAVEAARKGFDIEASFFARAARGAAPDTKQLDQLLACVASGGSLEDLPYIRRIQFLLDIAIVCDQIGQRDAAEARYQDVLDLEPGNTDAYLGLSRVRMPGPSRDEVLAQIHELVEPATYLEIGVEYGMSLALARPPTVAVAVDPAPQIRHPMSVETHLYRETSSEFFVQRDVRALFGGRGPSLVFIDGAHEWGAALEDFWQVEAISEPDTLIVLHDMIPFDEITSRPERIYNFYTGDVWKFLHCLADVRPDLSWFSAPIAPSGLTFVSGLDPTSTVLRDEHAALVERYAKLTFADAFPIPGDVVENDWEVIADRLTTLSGPSRRVGALGSASRPGPTAAAPDHVELSRRVRVLEARDHATRAEIDSLRQAARRAEGRLRTSAGDLEGAQAELEALRNTKLYRWTRPLRRVVARARGSEVT